MRARVRLLAAGVATCAVLVAWGARVDRYVSAQQAEQTAPDSPLSSAARDAARGADRPAVPLPGGPEVFTDSGGHSFRVVPIKGLSHPWSLAFLPEGNILVTELGGRSGSSATECSIRSRSPAYRRRTRKLGVRG